ncbi:glucosylglycerol-phosphate synthase [Coralloluteibacterium stylophorae]|uniref:Glucosylglycerol-phosphate synthase n=1 Tax=Coralloluteibacterium stylophorae TaxID=1776034 RepID=A0AAP2CAT3_9GAMM|nr:glucosylglycerol-phosphate synthase [Coralloluteibacterium stylophorae]
MLATDLDGTFLAGSPERRHELYQLLAGRDDLRLVYVTGRGLEAVMPLLSDPSLPRPDYIVCDVGGTVVDGRTLHPVHPLQAGIEARWPGERTVIEALGDWPGLERQDQPQDRRVAYFCEPGAISDELRRRVEELGLDMLYSGERYLDVLPRGVSKGASLVALAEHLGVPKDLVVVAGDTLNDLSMYQHGFRGVCVGESEIGLLTATESLDHVHHADEAGCGGILEALAQFGLHDAPERARGAAANAGSSELVIVYHRLPYEEYIQDGEVRRRNHASPNGIIPTLLSFFAQGQKGSWVAWTQHGKSEDFEPNVPVEPERYPGLTASRVVLTKTEVDIFYKRFSKEAFWPLLHTFWERARFREDHWKVFQRVNRAFAERTAAEAAPGATVWIHDYNLWLVPAYLRELRPDVRIAFFHHTYFPSADIFNVVPWRREILGSLLQCDYVGFHIPRQVENFVDVVRGVQPVTVLEREPCAPRYLTYGCAVGIERMTTALRTHGRVVRLGAHPVGLDLDRVRNALRSDVVRKRRAELEAAFGERKLILSVERLDYTKGTLEKLQAFEHMLANEPELHGKVSLLTICVPAAREMTVYDELQHQIEQAVGRINGRFSRVGWTPVQFFFRAFPFEEVVAYYAEADVMWITPLRDGLNLVCKEYVATQGLTRGDGVLVLSEFAGAAAELKGAVLTNPHDTADLVAGCLQAIRMPREERRNRIRGLVDIVRHHDIARWGREFLDAVRRDDLSQVPRNEDGDAVDENAGRSAANG